jgi:hypothetical protein
MGSANHQLEDANNGGLVEEKEKEKDLTGGELARSVGQSAGGCSINGCAPLPA